MQDHVISDPFHFGVRHPFSGVRHRLSTFRDPFLESFGMVVLAAEHDAMLAFVLVEGDVVGERRFAQPFGCGPCRRRGGHLDVASVFLHEQCPARSAPNRSALGIFLSRIRFIGISRRRHTRITDNYFEIIFHART